MGALGSRDRKARVLSEDSEEPYEEFVWRWWTPPDDRAALESAVESARLRHRWDIALPPAASTIGTIWEGPREEYALAFRCLDRLLIEDNEAWGGYVERIPDAVASIERLPSDGTSIDELGGATPFPLRDLKWFQGLVGDGQLDAFRRVDDERRSLISYYRKA